MQIKIDERVDFMQRVLYNINRGWEIPQIKKEGGDNVSKKEKKKLEDEIKLTKLLKAAAMLEIIKTLAEIIDKLLK